MLPKITAKHLMIALVAMFALLAITTLFGSHLQFDVLPALGMIAVGNIEDVGFELKTLLLKQGDNFEKFKQKQDDRFAGIEGDILELAKKANRPQVSGAAIDTKHTEQFIDAKSGKSIPVLSHTDKLLTLEQKADSISEMEHRSDMPSVGRLLRGIVLGGRAADAAELAEERKALAINPDSSGGYTAVGALSNEWIDALRAQMVLSKAGARTIPMDTSSLSLARVTADPTISWHRENAALPEAALTFGKIDLNAKTCVCLVKLSLELSQDSANIEQILQSTINSAMAAAIDRAGLVGVTTDAAAAPAGVMNLANRNSVTGIGAPVNWDFVVDGMYELMLDNVAEENIGALIAHPAVWKKMRKLKTGITSDETALTMPAEVAAMRKLWTTAAPLTGGTTAAGIIADWRDLIFGVRKDITVRVLSETSMGSNLQVLILAYARCDFAATRQESFCTLEGITV